MRLCAGWRRSRIAETLDGKLEAWMRLWGLGLLVMWAIPGASTAGQELPMAPHRLRIAGPVFVAVQVRDLALASGWYSSTFGLAQVNRIDTEDGRYSILILAGEGIEVELLQVRGATSGANPVLGLFKIGFYVDDIEAAHRWIQGRGGDTDERIFTDEALQARSFVFRDPEGNRLQAFQRCVGPCS